MFNHIYQCYGNVTIGFLTCSHKHTKHEQNVYFDSYLVHYRKIYDFFTGSTRKYDDIDCTAFDFNTLEINFKDQKIKTKINKTSLHITSFELEENHQWLLSAMFVSLLQPMKSFLEHLILQKIIKDEEDLKLAQETLDDLNIYPDLVLWKTKKWNGDWI